MLQTVFSNTLWFIALVLLQALVFNHIHILGYATPMPYIYFLLILPSNTPKWLYVALGFVTGVLIDMFGNTPGIAAATLTAVGLATPWFLRLYAPKDYDENDALRPGSRSMEWPAFLRYATTASLLHCLLFFTIEAFSFFDPLSLLINIAASTALTTLFIAAMELIRNEK